MDCLSPNTSSKQLESFVLVPDTAADLIEVVK